ncbi:MAG: hypothetical protein Tsb002_02220 [Wenzhouxiangellaceae bacterium]
MKKVKYIFSLLMLSFSNAAFSQLNIDEKCATTSGCFVGDSVGYPVTITQPGSYQLTTNLTSSDPNTAYIEILSDNVTIDFKGHSIIGPVTCSGNTPACSFTGNGLADGIKSDLRNNIVLKNGTVKGVGGSGIELFEGHNHHLINMTVDQNTFRGAIVGQAGLTLDSIISNNGTAGIIASNGDPNSNTLLLNNSIINNAEFGISSGVCGGNVATSNNDATPVNDEIICDGFISPNTCDGNFC